MAMVRSALGRLCLRRRLSGSSAAPSVRPEIHEAPGPPSLLPAAPWMPRPGPTTQPMRSFTSPPAGAAARTRRVPNLEGRQHFPVICKGTEGMKRAEQKRFLSVSGKAKDVKLMELARSAVKKFKAKMSEPADMVVAFLVASLTFLTAIIFRRCYIFVTSDLAINNLDSRKNHGNSSEGCGNGGDGKKVVKHSR